MTVRHQPTFVFQKFTTHHLRRPACSNNMTDDGICFRTTQLESDGQDRPLTFSAAVAQAEALPDPPQVALLNHLWHLRDTGGFDGAQKLQIEETECTMTYLRDGGGRRVSPYLIEDGLEGL